MINKKQKSSLYLIKNRINQLNEVKKHITHPIALSAWIQELFVLNGIPGARLVTQGYHGPVKPQPKSLIPGRPINLLYVGRLSKIKGIYLLLEAIQPHQSSYNLIIMEIPVQEEMTYYHTIKSTTEAFMHFEWHENLGYGELEQIYDRSDILCLPSRVPEMAPLVILEAFAHKVPVIGSDFGGIKYMVSDGKNGFLFSVNDSKKLSDILLNIKINPEVINTLQQNIALPKKFDAVSQEIYLLYEAQ